jgi:sec-independent protein translocase protein TatA
MMGLDNPIHIAFLLVVLLLVFGAKRLPEIGRSLGTGMRGFKESLTGENVAPPLGAHQPELVEATAKATVASAAVAPAASPTAPAEAPLPPNAR